MAKRLKNVFFAIFGGLAFLIAGAFFVGCGSTDYSKVSISANENAIELFVGQSQELTFKIDGYKSGFSTKVSVNPRTDGSSSIFTASQPTFSSKDTFSVTITATAGGTGTLNIVLLEGGKEIDVDVRVRQYASKMKLNNETLYVSNDTPLSLSANMFTFEDAHTTEKELSFYYIEGGELVNFDGLTVDKFDEQNLTATFSNNFTANLFKFSNAKLNDENKVEILDGSENKVLADQDAFRFLAIYDHSLQEEDLIYDIGKVYILPSLDVQIEGAYYLPDGTANFDSKLPDVISIVPNNENMVSFLLKITMQNFGQNVKMNIIKPEGKDKDNVVIDYFYDFDDEETDQHVRYVQISQNSLVQNSCTFGVEIFYDVATFVDDESVNFKQTFNVETQIAPSAILVNDKVDFGVLKLYYTYVSPEYGWNDLFVKVISGFETSPTFDGIYFEFDENYIEIVHGSASISNGSKRLFSDFSTPFQVRGKGGEEVDTEIVIHLKSDILQNDEKELTYTIKCSISEGARRLYMKDGYDQSGIYLDYDAGVQDFGKYIYAVSQTQSYSVRLTSGTDVVDITNGGIEKDEEDGNFYLQMKLMPKATGEGTYTFVLDNGVSITVTFCCVKTLSENTTHIQIISDDSGTYYTSFAEKSKPDIAFDDILNLEILNSSNDGQIIFGSTVSVQVIANATQFTQVLDTTKYINCVATGNVFRLTTHDENGFTTITINIYGVYVDDFSAINTGIVAQLKVSSYSLLDQFYLKNGDDSAISNTVYYSSAGESLSSEASSVTFAPYVVSEDSYSFYQYQFTAENIQNIYNQKGGFEGDYYYYFDENNNSENLPTQQLVYEKYNKKFIYFSALDSSGSVLDNNISTIVSVRHQFVSASGLTTNDKEIDITLYFTNGLMIYFGDEANNNTITYEIVQEGRGTDRYTVRFSNYYNVGVYGEFDMTNYTFTYKYTNAVEIVLMAEIDQRKAPLRFNAHIYPQQYISVQTVTLLSSTTGLNFTNSKLTAKIIVSLYPTEATSKDIRPEFVPTNGNKYSNMVKCEVDESSKNFGSFTIIVSCEDFYNLYHKELDELDDSMGVLTGLLYIYPLEWGDNHSAIKSSLSPICLDVQYRNGSRKNPYLLESAEDVLDINKNETTLKSHYQVSSVIDMDAVSNARPIGILSDGTLLGFSGSIVGTTSQAAITNVHILYQNTAGANFNFSHLEYQGLFAKINEGATVENLLIEGNITMRANGDGVAHYVSLFACVNEGTLVNVGTKLQKSQIEHSVNATVNTNQDMFFGTLVCVNHGKILQDFTKYDGTGYTFDDKGNIQDQYNFTGLTSKNLAYFDGELSIVLDSNSVYVGGIVAMNHGRIERISPSSDDFKLYGYTAYSAYALISVSGRANAVYVGTVAGVSTTKDALSTVGEYCIIQNMLVGGEISTLFCESKNANDSNFLGGIVGYASEGKDGKNPDDENDLQREYTVQILKNTSRTFLKGRTYVGGIVGFDYYASGVVSSAVFYGTENVIEVVDHLLIGLNASGIIRIGTDTSLFNWELSSEETVEDKLKDKKFVANFAIGNTFNNGRAYANLDVEGEPADDFMEFSAKSYLRRTKISSSEAISLSYGTTTEYYGDYLFGALQNDGSFVINKAFDFQDRPEVVFGLSSGSDFAMTSSDGGNLDVFFMYHFAVTSDVSGKLGAQAQDEIESLNSFSPNSKFYPFALSGNDVSIQTSSSNVLMIDAAGNITTKSTGLTTINLSSILNEAVIKTIYIYVVNFFNKDILKNTSIFFSDPSLNSSNIPTTNGLLVVRGESYEDAYVLPTYSCTIDDKTTISHDGVLMFENVAYNLAANTAFTIDVSFTEQPLHTTFDVSKQSIIFVKTQNAQDGMTDTYTLVPVLQVLVDGKTYVYSLDNSKINLNVRYQDAASNISTKRTSAAMRTDGSFSDSVYITSTSSFEWLYYEIEGVDVEFSQSRTPKTAGFNPNEIQTSQQLLKFLNEYTASDLFVMTFSQTGVNKYDFTCKINMESAAYKNRFSKNIYGQYKFTFFSSEFYDGVSCTVMLTLDEAVLSCLDVTNHSNANDYVTVDEIIVPNQRGILEITLDPIDAVFNQIYISNNKTVNSASNVGNATFEFMYQQSTATGVEYVTSATVGYYDASGAFTFTYDELMQYFESVNAARKKEIEDAGGTWTNAMAVQYTGKLYISYILQSVGVADGAAIAFDVKVTFGSGEYLSQTINLQAKLTNFANLTFVDKELIGEYYFLARGLTYELTLDSYGFSTTGDTSTLADGFTEGQITHKVSAPEQVTIKKQNGRYYLTVTKNRIVYPDDIGFFVTLTTTATKIVDGITVKTESVLKIYLMEYVLNYQYVGGTNEDIVHGMHNGVISDAIGNPYTLQLDILDFVEYDSSIPEISIAAQQFITSMTNNVKWTVVDNVSGGVGKTETTLENDKTITAEYYIISSFTVTPIKLYDPANDVYHFTVEGMYQMISGSYIFTATESSSTNLLRTEFAFDVHQQSTQDSPIPVENLDDFLKMEDGGWYILLDDIVLPSSEMAAAGNVKQWSPLATAIAGLDGNGYSLIYDGTYNFSGQANIGVFERVAEGSILQNVTVELRSSTVFTVDVETFNVGLLVAENEGTLTNCFINGNENGFSVQYSGSTAATMSYVGAIAAINSGFITNSRSAVGMFANVNLAGFVGSNSGHISSSYFRGASLKNETHTENEYTAGFVVQNTGEIYASYVSGDESRNQDTMYYDNADPDTQNNITSSGDIAGFVYENSGNIFDCYSNIYLQNTNYFASGFVFTNIGRIERSFSTSVLQGKQTSNYGFVRTNNVDEEDKGIYDCFYLCEDGTNGVEINNKIGAPVLNDVNEKLTNVKSLSISEFNIDGEGEEFFENFVVGGERDTNSVWFFSNNKTSSPNNFDHKTFNTGRIELVAANIIAKSQRIYINSETITDATTGVSYVQYNYRYNSVNFAALGSEYNPILISTAENMEKFIKQETNPTTKQNFSHYRIVNDIDYAGYPLNSELYETKFLGYLEGNFMSVSNINLFSIKELSYAGLFAEIGSSEVSNAIGTVMNLTYNPKTVNFANAGVVGAVAGIVDGGTLLNISLDDGEDQLIEGNYIVGGAVGLTSGNFKLQNIYSTYGAKTRNQEVNNDSGDLIISDDMKDYSIAGSIVGALSGRGEMANCETNSKISVLAGVAGLMFGFVDHDVTIENITLVMQEEMFVKAYDYGGLIAGESKGDFKNVEIIGFGGEFESFIQSPYVPVAVGGVAGILRGGNIEDVKITQGISTSKLTDSVGVTYLGGVAGVVDGTVSITGAEVAANFTGYSSVGGILGGILRGGSAYITNIKVTGGLRATGLGATIMAVAGVVGSLQLGASTTTTISSDRIDEISVIEKSIKDKNEELNGLIPETNPIEYARIKAEIVSLQNEIKNLKNWIDVDIDLTTFVESGLAGGNVGVSAVLGFDSSENIQVVSHTYSSLTGSASVYVKMNEYRDDSCHKVVEAVTDEATGQTTYSLNLVDGMEFTNCIPNLSATSLYFCDFTYNVSVKGSVEIPTPYAVINLNLFGSPYIWAE